MTRARHNGHKAVGATSNEIRALDLFSGVGGSSAGVAEAGVRLSAAIDAWPLAAKTYKENFPKVEVYARKCERVSAREILRKVGPIDLIVASPECTSHTCAKGKAKRSEKSRQTAFQVLRFARVLKPRWIVVENVVNMRRWSRYREWLSALKGLGYHCREQVLNAADFGVPQARNRLFVVCDRISVPPDIVVGSNITKATAASIIERNGLYEYSRLAVKRRAEATLKRAQRARRTLGPGKPFILVYYGSDGAGGWQKTNVPLRTITTLDRFAYVRRRRKRYEMRMLQVPELQRAMGFRQMFKLNHGARRDKIKLLGNAVCPPVMKAIITALTRRQLNGAGARNGAS